MNSKRHGCSCEKCRECCTREPGWFLPNEVKISAAFMGISEKDFIKNFCEGHLDDNIRVISPARKPNSRECIFLNKAGLCEIHEVKPHECRKVYGCEGLSRHRRIREMIKREWGK